jgi:hypothetical protein
VNNSIIDHLHQKMGCLPEIKPEIGYKCMDKYGWGDAGICVLKHEALLENIMGNKLKKYKFDHHVAKDYERISINAISWLGSEFAKFGGKVGTDEEKWLSEIKPAEIKMPNVIFGGALCCHFAFYVQRAQVDKTHLLAWYKKISVEESRSSLR